MKSKFDFASRRISFVIPCFRSEDTITDVVDELIVTMGRSTPFDVILVNDASPDGTQVVLSRLAERYPQVKVVELARNSGQQGAWMAGFQFVTGDAVAIMEDDGQSPVDELPNLLKKLGQGYDVVFAKYSMKRHSWFRNLGSKVHFQLMEFLFDKPRGLSITSFAVFRRFVIEEIKRYENPYPYLAGLVLNATGRIGNIEVRHRPRVKGRSGYTLRKLISLLINGITAYSVKPLRIASVTGFFFIVASFAFAIYIIYMKLHYSSVPLGYSSIMTAILFIGGFTMMLLGLIGEYVGRIYVCLNRKPQFVVRSTTNIHPDVSQLG